MKVRRQWYAVRCCCAPMKLFGFIPLPDPTPKQTIRDRCGQVHHVEVMAVSKHRRCLTSMRDFTAAANYDPAAADELFVDDELAVYSDDRPLEFWRTIPGFIEAGNQEDE